MSKPVTYYPKNRLVSLMRKPGGVTMEEGVAEAKSRLERIRGECSGELDALIESLQIDDLSRGGFRRFYIQCAEILNLTGAFGFEDEKSVAKVLCSLLEALGLDTEAGPATDADLAGLKKTLEVIADGLKFLRRSGKHADHVARTEIVRGLQQVADKRLGNKSGASH